MCRYVHIVLYLYEQEFTCHATVKHATFLIDILPVNVQYRKNQHTRGGVFAGVFGSPIGSTYPSYRMHRPHARPHAHAHRITSSHVRSFSTFQDLLQQHSETASCVLHPMLHYTPSPACLPVSP